MITQSQMFIRTAELAIPTLTPTNKTNAKIETQTLTAETKAKECSKQLKACAAPFVEHLRN